MKPAVPPFIRKDGFGTLGLDFDQPALPPAVEFTPATWGAWGTLGLLVGLAAWGVLGLFRRHRRRAPRRAAMRALRRLEAGDTHRAHEILVLLKTLALDSYGRTRVAALSGARWRTFLIAGAPGAGFEGRAGDALILLAERGSAALDAASRAALFRASARWIVAHGSVEEGQA